MLSGKEIQSHMRRETLVALERHAHRVLRLAEERVPIGDPELDPDPEEHLRTRGKVEAPHVGLGGSLRISVVFEGPYAVKQHEAQQFKHPRGGRSKYLESAWKELLPLYRREVEQAVSRAV